MLAIISIFLFQDSWAERTMDWKLRKPFTVLDLSYPGTILTSPFSMGRWPCLTFPPLKYKPKICVSFHCPIYRMGGKFLSCLLCKVKTECDHALKNVNSYGLLLLLYSQVEHFKSHMALINHS